MRVKIKIQSQSGFSLIELLVGVIIFMIIAVGVYQAYNATTRAVRASRYNTVTTALANEQLEIIRNLPYEDVGVVASLPSGVIERTQILSRDGMEFTVQATIRNVDDPFDGVIGGTPNDLSPADYKLVEIEIACNSCDIVQPLRFSTAVMPRSLEGTSTNGALFVQVFDAVGQPVVGANVHVENNQVTPAIIIDDTTNNDGLLQLVDVPPGIEAYEITVSKSGYSSDQTYPSGAPTNPNPTKPHATVAVQQRTQISFAIDRISTIDVTSVRSTCVAVPSIDFLLAGSKLIGLSPDVFKYSASHVTDSSGRKIIPNLEWDTYNFTLTDSAYDLAGTIPFLPLNLNPNSSQDLKLVVELKDPRAFLVAVKDASTQLPVSGASVKIQWGADERTKVTGQGFISQTDWSGGAGQDNFFDPLRFFSHDGNIEISDPAGELKLRETLGNYETSGSLISSAFDMGAPVNFYQILWLPQDQPPEAGADSVRFQVATNNDNTTWNFFGPDGTVNTFYTLADQNINSLHNGNRYFRYQIFLGTASSTWTPNVSDISFTFTSSCTPPGQVYFKDLSAATYTLTVTKNGYQVFTDTVDISSPWQYREVILSP